MLITSLTTAIAFASNWINSVLPVCLFGEFMFLLILANYLLVITMFPAVVVISHIWFDSLTWRVPLPFPLIGVFGAIALAAGGSSGAAAVVLLLGIALVLVTLTKKDGQAFLPPLQPIVNALPGAAAPADGKADDEGSAASGEPQLQWVERWFNTVGSDFIIGAKKPIFWAFSAMTVVVLFGYAIRMERATELVRLWQPDSMFETYSDVVLQAWPKRETVGGRYGCEPDCQDVYVVFGVHAADNGNVFVRPADQYENGRKRNTCEV